MDSTTRSLIIRFIIYQREKRSFETVRDIKVLELNTVEHDLVVINKQIVGVDSALEKLRKEVEEVVQNKATQRLRDVSSKGKEKAYVPKAHKKAPGLVSLLQSSRSSSSSRTSSRVSNPTSSRAYANAFPPSSPFPSSASSSKPCSSSPEKGSVVPSENDIIDLSNDDEPEPLTLRMDEAGMSSSRKARKGKDIMIKIVYYYKVRRIVASKISTECICILG